MIRSLLIVIMFTQFNQSAMAHKCILNGNSAAEITVYNACKNDLVMEMDGHGPSATSTASATDQAEQKLLLLEAENKQLQSKLDLLRNRLLDLIKNL